MTRKRTLVITILVLLAASVVTASIMLSGKRDNIPSPGTSLGTNAEGFAISPVVAGAGGTALGPDGVTPIGYPPTCEGAYAAAINYRKAIQTTDSNWPKVRETLLQISADPQALASRLEITDELVEQYGMGNYVSADTQTLGIFKPLECEAGKSALLLVSDVSTLHYPESNPSVMVQAAPVKVVWQNGDWKFASTPSLESTEFLSLELQADTAPAMTPEIINALFTANDGQAISREGWLVVNNASR
ncbi:hypothetical protein [Paeniglutamicibacter gangotriensis]|uniref:DUF8175 domain-containing protein n=1 Tax=Paeniglutamicibacter gangotriensis Lz1y TaxID=1276920 RepID=M7NEB3_9MICC|nr:hypothetical protein [Paeniglutamicibacter gangotriensis]EMQ96818.1 hypothetical protein ADIAG_03955 [Paeniglutamicibacter gangotriensis Lz1y]